MDVVVCVCVCACVCVADARGRGPGDAIAITICIACGGVRVFFSFLSFTIHSLAVTVPFQRSRGAKMNRHKAQRFKLRKQPTVAPPTWGWAPSKQATVRAPHSNPSCVEGTSKYKTSRSTNEALHRKRGWCAHPPQHTPQQPPPHACSAASLQPHTHGECATSEQVQPPARRKSRGTLGGTAAASPQPWRRRKAGHSAQCCASSRSLRTSKAAGPERTQHTARARLHLYAPNCSLGVEERGRHHSANRRRPARALVQEAHD
jgi:hypothetical protein